MLYDLSSLGQDQDYRIFISVATIGVRHPRRLGIFDFTYSTNFLYIWFSSTSQINFPLSTRHPQISKWLILSKKFIDLSSDSLQILIKYLDQTKILHMHYQSILLSGLPQWNIANFLQSSEIIGNTSLNDTKHIILTFDSSFLANPRGV